LASTTIATADVPQEERSDFPSPEPLHAHSSDVFRRQDLWTVLQQVLSLCRHVSGEPHLFIYDVVWHVDNHVPDLTPSEVVDLWELAGTQFTWLDGRTDEETWKLKDAGRVLRKVRGAKNTMHMARAKRDQGLLSGRELWWALEHPLDLTPLSQVLGWQKPKTLKALRRLEGQGFVIHEGKAWKRVGEDLPPDHEPLPLHQHRSRSRTTSVRKFPTTPMNITDLVLTDSGT
jgi:hypothetical protein